MIVVIKKIITQIISTIINGLGLLFGASASSIVSDGDVLGKLVGTLVVVLIGRTFQVNGIKVYYNSDCQFQSLCTETSGLLICIHMYNNIVFGVLVGIIVVVFSNIMLGDLVGDTDGERDGLFVGVEVGSVYIQYTKYNIIVHMYTY